MIKEIIEFLSEHYGIEKNEIHEESSFVADLGLSSYSVIEMCCELEEKYKIEISEDDIVNLITVKDLSDYLSNTVMDEIGRLL